MTVMTKERLGACMQGTKSFSSQSLPVSALLLVWPSLSLHLSSLVWHSRRGVREPRKVKMMSNQEKMSQQESQQTTKEMRKIKHPQNIFPLCQKEPTSQINPLN